jgi:hypothetical protein
VGVVQELATREGVRAALYVTLDVATSGAPTLAWMIVKAPRGPWPAYGVVVDPATRAITIVDPGTPVPTATAGTRANGAQARAPLVAADTQCPCSDVCAASLTEMCEDGLAAAIVLCAKSRSVLRAAVCGLGSAAVCAAVAGGLNVDTACGDLFCGPLFCGCRAGQVPCPAGIGGLAIRCVSAITNENCGDCGVTCSHPFTCKATFDFPECKCAQPCPEGKLQDPRTCDCSCPDCPPGMHPDPACDCVPNTCDPCENPNHVQDQSTCACACPPCTDPSHNQDPETCNCCPAGRTSCGQACADTQTNNEHCGGSGIDCGFAQLCIEGRCTECGPGERACADAVGSGYGCCSSTVGICYHAGPSAACCLPGSHFLCGPDGKDPPPGFPVACCAAEPTP